MLNDNEAIAMIAVKDLATAARFYEGTLGLTRLSTEGEEAITYRSGSGKLNVYRSQFAGTNKATAAMWNVGAEIEVIVAHLKSKGVPFEHYDLPGLTRHGDIHECGSMKAAWFKDPDGNILSIATDQGAT
jgi:catechol 2,3-dioxygenase-like lactoylglutathione lyase family enzyme